MTEGSGVGVSKEPPVCNASERGSIAAHSPQPPWLDGGAARERPEPAPDGPDALHAQAASSLCFELLVPGLGRVAWETVLVPGALFVDIPPGILPDGSRDSLVTLLEYAEEQLRVSHVIVCFRKNRVDRANLIRLFKFLGFSLLPPGSPLVPNLHDTIFMDYDIHQEE